MFKPATCALITENMIFEYFVKNIGMSLDMLVFGRCVWLGVSAGVVGCFNVGDDFYRAFARQLQCLLPFFSDGYEEEDS